MRYIEYYNRVIRNAIIGVLWYFENYRNFAPKKIIIKKQGNYGNNRKKFNRTYRSYSIIGTDQDRTGEIAQGACSRED